MSQIDDWRSRLSGGGDSEESIRRREKSEAIADKYRRRAAERAAGRSGSSEEAPRPAAKPVRTETPAKAETPKQTAAPARAERPQQTAAPRQNERPKQAAAPKQNERPKQTAAPKQTERPKQAAAPKRPSASARKTYGAGSRNRSAIFGVAALLILVIAIFTIVHAVRNNDSRTSAGGNSGSGVAADATAESLEGSAADAQNAAGETDAEGNPVAATDAAGNPIAATDANGETITDPNAIAAPTLPEETTSSTGYTGEKFADTGIPAVALTFDDGPKSSTTPVVLDIMEQYNAHCTFFMVGQNVAGNEDLIKRMETLGCELGNHTWDHAQLKKLSDDAFNEEISKATAAIEAAADHTKVTVMRPPYGAITDGQKQMVDLPIIQWEVDTLDWKTKDTQATIDTVREQIKGGDIVLMHDIHEPTVEAVKTIVPMLQEKGYKLLTVSELYEYYGEELTPHVNHRYAEAPKVASTEAGEGAAESGSSAETAASTAAAEGVAQPSSAAADTAPAASDSAAESTTAAAQ